jgi:hypothetical protein
MIKKIKVKNRPNWRNLSHSVHPDIDTNVFATAGLPDGIFSDQKYQFG